MVIRVLLEMVSVSSGTDLLLHHFLKNDAFRPYKLFKSYIIAHWYSMAFFYLFMTFLLQFMGFCVSS